MEKKSLVIVLAMCFLGLCSMAVFIPTASVGESEKVITPRVEINDYVVDQIPKIESEVKVKVGKDVANVQEVNALSQGIRRLIDKRDHGIWYYCGKLLTKEEQKVKSHEIAYNVLYYVDKFNAKRISPWGIVATAYNESGLDACALGYYPRKWGYATGLLKKRRNTISHTLKEVQDYKNNPKVKNKYAYTGLDLGICQILSRFYRTRVDEMLTLGDGSGICVKEMKLRAAVNRTDKPWLYWKGHKTEWYRGRVRRFAKIMGATDEIMSGI